MAKRFFDSSKFDDPWYRALSPVQKCFWEYLLCRCDHAGIWKVDFEGAAWHVGGKWLESPELDIFMDKVILLRDADFWFIPRFVSFQYGVLNHDVSTHRGVIAALNRFNICEKTLKVKSSIRVRKGYSTLKDKDKDKDKVKSVYAHVFDTLWEKYPSKDGKTIALRHFNATVLNDQNVSDITKALDNYLSTKRVREGFVKNGSTWFNQWKDFINYTEPSGGKHAERDPSLFRPTYRKGPPDGYGKDAL